MRRWVLTSGLAALLMSVGLCRAQDFALGGGLDLELRVGSEVDLDFGRDSAIRLTVNTAEVTVDYEFVVAGGDGNVTAFNAQFGRWQGLRLILGRFLVPFGSPDMEYLDKYVAGAPDLFDYFEDYRRGNIFLDTFGDGVWARFQRSRWQLDGAVAFDPHGDNWNLYLRAGRPFSSGDAGFSYFNGKSASDKSAYSIALDGALYPSWGELRLEPVLGRVSGVDYLAVYGELRGFFRKQWEAGLKGGLYSPDEGDSTSTGKLLLRYWQNASSFWEAFYEFNDAPGDAGDDRFVLRYRIDF